VSEPDDPVVPPAPTIYPFFVWVTSSNVDYAEAAVAKLVRRGFTVAPLGRQLITQHVDNPACVIAFSLLRQPRNDEEKKEYTATGIHGEVTDVIRHVKGKWWSLIVSVGAASTWNIGNERSSEAEKVAEAAKKLN
jgi:hypothetical protein